MCLSGCIHLKTGYCAAGAFESFCPLVKNRFPIQNVCANENHQQVCCITVVIAVVIIKEIKWCCWLSIYYISHISLDFTLILYREMSDGKQHKGTVYEVLLLINLNSTMCSERNKIWLIPSASRAESKLVHGLSILNTFFMDTFSALICMIYIFSNPPEVRHIYDTQLICSIYPGPSLNVFTIQVEKGATFPFP